MSAAAPAAYTLTYANAGPSVATDVVVTDTLPAGLAPQPSTGCTISGQIVTCAVGEVAVGGSGTVTINATVDASLPLGASLTDVATIAGAASDPTAADDTSSFASIVDAANDVAVDVVAEQDEVRPGDRASFRVVVTNNGPQRASGVSVVNELPAAVVVPAAAPGGSSRRLPSQVPTGCLPTGGTATCLVGDLAVGASRTVVFAGTVAAGTPAGTQLVHTATVTADGTDVVSTNNVDRDTILVLTQSAPTTTTTPPATTTTTTVRVRCADLTFADAQRRLAAGARYLDGDGDGIACERDSGGGLPSTGTSVGVIILTAGVAVLAGTGLRTAVADRKRRPPSR